MRVERVARPDVSARWILLLGLVGSLLLAAVCPSFARADEISDKRAQAQQIAQKVSELDGQMMQLDNDYSVAQASLEQANSDIIEVQKQLDDTQKQLDQQRKELSGIAVQAYVEGNDSPQFEALMTSSGDQAPQKVSYLHVATGNRQDVIGQMRATEAEHRTQIDQLNEAKGAAQEQSEKMAKAKADAEAALDQQRQLKVGIDGQLADLVQQEQADQAAALQVKLQQQVADQAAQAATVAQATPAVLAAAPSPATAQAGPTAPTATAPTPTTPRATAPTPTAPVAPSTPAGPTPTTPRPTTPTPSTPATPAPPAPSSGAAAAVAAAYSALGVPYVFGGASMSGFDCSGLTSWAWAKGGKGLARTTYGQFGSGTRVPMNALQPGDLIFYNGVGHVGIYVGGGMIIHAPHTGVNVRLDNVYFWGPIDGAVRP